MTYFFAGLITGAVLALISVRFFRHTNTNDEQQKESGDEQVGLNSEQKAAAEFQKELERQFIQMMRYTGKEQRKA